MKGESFAEGSKRRCTERQDIVRAQRHTQTEAFLEFARNSVGMRLAVERMDGSGPEWVGADEVAAVVEAWAKQGS